MRVGQAGQGLAQGGVGADHSGARFWWRFAAGFGHPVAEYCLFLEHAHSGEYDDADHWRTELLRHHFVPDLWCGDRSTAPLLSPLSMDPLCPHIQHQHHPGIGTVPLPTFSLVGRLRQLTSLL
ncbi:hypothetical protein [Streptomyces sp. enrichment culture]|uniref:hypothetical protein n=1 Tax=Streptomyces sp. enrichment culture TaxID=1795815 RepID=UPI003F55C175